MTSHNHKLYVSIFRNRSGRNIEPENDITLEELAKLIDETSAKTKDNLPWLKLASFGNKRTDNHSLRHDANVREIYGIELDYDDEKIPFDDAVEKMRALRLGCLLYTSPSYTAQRPRWRILCPTSEAKQPECRAKLVARLNGALGCILGSHVESFTLSQSFYFGRALDNTEADHRTVVLHGDFIDRRDDLQVFEAKGAPAKNPFEQAGADADDATEDVGIHGFDNILKEIGDGPNLRGFNDPLTRAIASYVALHNGNPFDQGKLKALLRDAIDKAPKAPARKHQDIERYKSDKYLDDAIRSASRKFIEQHAMRIENFLAYLPTHQYLYIPTCELWPPSSLAKTLPPVPIKDKHGRPIVSRKTKRQKTMPATEWLDKHRYIQQMTWMPGLPSIIEDRIVHKDGGWINEPGARCYNLYIPPRPSTGNPVAAGMWLQHIERIYPNEVDHIVKWLAHRVQKPGEKINHALMLGGAQGIGKDTIVEPVKRAVGAWNFADISPVHMLGRFNGFMRSVIMRVNETRDTGGDTQMRFNFYDHFKTYAASPPDVIRVDEKNLREHYVFNCTGVILTTNYKTDGFRIPADDRRTFVAWSKCEREDFSDRYWKDLWSWYNAGGDQDVGAYLATLDISSFDAKAPPPRTEAFYSIVMASWAPEQSTIADLIDSLGNPKAVTLEQIHFVADMDFSEWMIKNARQVPHKMESAGYEQVRNDAAKDGYFKINNRRQPVYAMMSLSKSEQQLAVSALIHNYDPSPAGTTPKNPFNNVHTLHPKGGKPKG